jgi:hypothetical protein
MHAHPDHADRRPDGCIWIAILALRRSASGRLHQSSLIWTLERKSEADRSLEVIRTGCWDVRSDASWNRSFSMQWRVRTEIHVVRMYDPWSVWVSRRYGTSSGRMEQWTDERPDGMTCRPDGWQGTDFSDLLNLLKHFWIAESLVKQHLYIQVILSKQNEANHKLTIIYQTNHCL